MNRDDYRQLCLLIFYVCAAIVAVGLPAALLYAYYYYAGVMP